MINHSAINCNDKTIHSYTVSADELHIFIDETISRLGGIRYNSDTYIDYERMLHDMNEGGGWVWSIRATGTWFMPVLNYARCQPDQFFTPLVRYVVVRRGDTYKFTEFIEL